MARDRPTGRMALPRAPGAQTGPVRVHPTPAPGPAPSLEEELTDAVEAAILGEPLRPSLAGRAKTAALAVLHRRGVAGARVHAALRGAGVDLQVMVPAGPARVERIVLSVHTGV